MENNNSNNNEQNTPLEQEIAHLNRIIQGYENELATTTNQELKLEYYCCKK